MGVLGGGAQAETFKASMILSSEFKALVSPAFGWPVYVVVPCRDFMFVVSEKDRDNISKLGGVVVKEYGNSSYPITTDVLEVSDKGIHAIGGFAPPK